MLLNVTNSFYFGNLLIFQVKQAVTPLVNSDIKGANPADSLLAWVKVATHSKVIPGNDLYLKSKFIIEPQIINLN